MTAQDNITLIESFFNAVNSHDVDRAVSLVDQNVEWVNVPTGETLHGPNDLRRLMQDWFKAFPDYRVDIRGLVADENGIAVEYTARATHSGSPYSLPTGPLPPTGRQMQIHFCDVYQIRNGKIVSDHNHYDMYSLKQQLGQGPMTRQAGA